MKFPVVFLLLSLVAATYSTNVTGSFGNQVLKIDIEFGNDVMVATIHRPDNAQDTFRETTNLHIFSTHLLAVRNSIDKQCYIRHFVESEVVMRGRVQNAKFNHGEIDQVMEERLNLEGIEPISPRTVQLLLGPKIAAFCHGHDVYLLSLTDYSVLDLSEILLKGRPKRAIRPVDIAGTCCQIPALDLSRMRLEYQR